MKLPYIILILLVFIFSIGGLKSQSINNNLPVLPLKSSNSVLFGKDVIINDQSARDQRNVAICSAFNGWLYASYSYMDGLTPYLTVLRSEDNGISWNVMVDDVAWISMSVVKINIMACGNTVSDLKIFLGWVLFDSTINGGVAFVSRFAGEPFGLEATIFSETSYKIKDLALANDYLYPSPSSNPYSIAILYTKYHGQDSVICRTSSNGGITLDNYQGIAKTSHFFRDVSLSYGYSPSWNTGRYFAAWEEFDNEWDHQGHIFVAHSNPSFNSSFTRPICLDSLKPSLINNCKNPVISCQVSNSNNDSANITEIALFEKYLSGNNSHDIQGFYNLQATNKSHFNEFSLSSSSDNKLQPDISFNNYASNFMVTYYDSTMQKLPFLTNDMNLVNPNSWTIVSSGYNDSSNLLAPHPKVELNLEQQNGVNVWTAGRAGENGIAMFDGPYNYPAGISQDHQKEFAILYGAHPNPCKDVTNIGFELKKPEKVNITLFDMYGQPIEMLTDQNYSAGKHDLRIDVSKYPSGTYIYKFQTSETVTSNRLIVVK